MRPAAPSSPHTRANLRSRSRLRAALGFGLGVPLLICHPHMLLLDRCLFPGGIRCVGASRFQSRIARHPPMVSGSLEGSVGWCTGRCPTHRHSLCSVAAASEEGSIGGGCGEACLVAIDECLEEGCSVESVDRLLEQIRAEERELEAGLSALRGIRASLEQLTALTTAEATDGARSPSEETPQAVLERAREVLKKAWPWA
mmetsp:Transcript_125347/g.348792  ORF Transcript_125347/g.348792 Transcript_125347/m.348792 type:complete len:200 (-) Transcript_125347:132-731(-)